MMNSKLKKIVDFLDVTKITIFQTIYFIIEFVNLRRILKESPIFTGAATEHMG